ncbi:hypothetical protein LSR23_32235, partial [Klebsiella michiganensis]|nr:hypothetical protein [Klebsiella michiganensis]
AEGQRLFERTTGYQTLLLASASGLVWTLLQRLVTRRSPEQPLAFGPWLALAGGGTFLWSQV